MNRTRVLSLLRGGFLALWLVSLAVFFLPQSVYGDDCLTDPLNAADCMRTPGFRQGITVVLGATATAGVVVTNLIGQSVVNGQPPEAPGDTQDQPPDEDQFPDEEQGPDDETTPDEDSPPDEDLFPDEETPPEETKEPDPDEPQKTPPDEPAAPGGDEDSIFTFDNFKRLVDYPNKLLQVLDKYKLTPDAIEKLKMASRMWRNFPNKATADKYIQAVRDRMNTTGKTGKFLDWGGKLMDAADAILKAQKVIEQRGYTGWEKAGALYVEGANKVFVTMLTKNPVVAIVDQVAGDLTGHNIESTIRAGEEKWHQVTQEYANNIYDADAIEAQIQTKDQGLRFIRKIKQQIADGTIPRDVGVQRARMIYDKMVK